MSFLKLASTRFSVRKYKNIPVEREKIFRCLEAARLTPSACNSQPWHFVVVDNPEEVGVLADKTTIPLSKLNRFTKGVPVIVEGVLKGNQWKDKEGKGHSKVVVRAAKIHVLIYPDKEEKEEE